jgi:HAD superfamily hydrolase (TIGR01509 family)
LFTGMSIQSVADKVRTAWGVSVPIDFIERLRARDRIAFERELKAVAHVEDVLTHLGKANIAFCVASSGTPEKIHHSLELTGLLPWFDDHVFSATQVAHGKPAPDLFTFAAARMDVPAGHCLVIEDAAPGVQGGVAAGMDVFGFIGASHCTPHSGEALLASGAKRIFASMSDLPGLLAACNSRS